MEPLPRVGCTFLTGETSPAHIAAIWTVFIAFAGLVLTQVVDPATAQAILSLITGTG
jgi:hypothetical protein